MKTKTVIKIRGYHIDLFGHVNNSRYLEFLEEARWQYLDEQLNLEDLLKKNLSFVVVNINISYKSPAVFGEEILIESEINRVGNKSATFKQIIRDKNNPEKTIVDADVTFVVLNNLTGKAHPIDEEIKELLL